MGNLFACLLIYLVILCVVLLHSLLLSTCPSISYTYSLYSQYIDFLATDFLP